VRLSYSHEKELMGTAGGVKKVEAFLKHGTFLVMSGDGLTDIDLTELIAFHRARRSLATMALSGVDTRFDYGVTLADKRGRIDRFVEKPTWGDVFSNQVNTGIYVFEPAVLQRIPAHQFYDFGKQVWPGLLERHEQIHAMPTTEFWCDIGNLTEYRRAQKAFMDLSLYFRPNLPEKQHQQWIAPDVSLKGVRIVGPCIIEQGVKLAPGCVLGPYCVIGRRSQIDARCTLSESILWENVRLKSGVIMEHSIVTSDVIIPSCNARFDGAIMTKNGNLSVSKETTH
jgi:mannose-1-phosphate guanylyltransferase/phosphomannomutase